MHRSTQPVRGADNPRRAFDANQPLLWRLQLYLSGLSVSSDSDVDEHVNYPYAEFDAYWRGEERQAYPAWVAGRPAGFILVQRSGPAPPRSRLPPTLLNLACSASAGDREWVPEWSGDCLRTTQGSARLRLPGRP